MPPRASISTVAAAFVTAAAVACTPRSTTGDETTRPASAPPDARASAIANEPDAQAISIPARDGAPTHLAVLLHGVGADAASFQDIGRALGGGLPRVEFLVPDGFHPFDGGGTGRQWFSLLGVTDENRAARIRQGATEVSGWIDGELARRHLGGDRLVVLGFSQGAMIAAWLAVHRTPRPAAVVVLSGLVADDDVAAKTAVPTPVLVAHGAQDPRIPVTVVEPGARILEAWGARVTLRIYPGLAHRIDPRELHDVEEFLKSVLAPT